MKMLGFRKISKSYTGWIAGVEAHGDKYELVDYEPNKNYDADCFYQTNLMKKKFSSTGIRFDGWGQKYQYILDQKKPFIVSESPCFREGGYKRYGWWSYGWTTGNFNNDNVDSYRWDKFSKNTGTVLKDWNSPGDAILIIGQKEGDSALNSLYADLNYRIFYDWIEDIITEIRKYTDRKIIIRPHPKNINRGRKLASRIEKKYKNVEASLYEPTGFYQGGESLEHALSQAYCVITYSSNTGVEAVTRGIPVYAFDKDSMVYPLSQKKLSNIENLNYNIDTQDWKNKIAYTFWHPKELKRGDAWAHLKPVYFN